MDDNDQMVKQDQLPPTSSQNKLSSYTFLLRLSRRMGTIATRSFLEVRDFLHHDISIHPKDGFLGNFPRLHLQRRSEQKIESKPSNGSSGQGGIPASEPIRGMSDDSSKGGKHDDEQEGRDRKTAAEKGETEVDAGEKDLEKIISQSHEVLAEASTVFPVKLFPDTVVVDRTKVTIIKRDFFWSSDTMTFRIEDVLNAEVTVGPLFGSLIIASRVMSTTDHFRIDHFWRNDAIYLKRIIQGYIIARHNQIDVAHLPKDELIKTLSELGYHRSN